MDAKRGFPFEKLAPLPWKVMPGGTGISCSDEKGSKVCATRAGHAFPDRGERESHALAQAIALRVNVFDDMLAALKSAAPFMRNGDGGTRGGRSEMDRLAGIMEAAIAKAERA